MRFRDYEDVWQGNEPFLFHLILIPCLSIDLITPDQVFACVLDYAQQSEKVSFNSLEGFKRQVLGRWKFICAVYLLGGEKEKETNSGGRHERDMPTSFNSGDIGCLLTRIIRRVKDRRHVHHIERRRIIGNFMLLGEIDPYEEYRGFVEMFVDGYERLMVPNIFGMRQYADGVLIATKPDINSSSNYILKTSDYRGGEGCDV